MSERVLILAAHPDDESLGCGATVSRHVLSGDAVSIVAFADGVSSRGAPAAAIDSRHTAFVSACGTLGVTDASVHNFRDNQMDSVPLLIIVNSIEAHIERFRPTVIYTHWIGDLNVDHQVMHRATNVACRPQPGRTVKRLLYFEIPCSTTWGEGFVPNYFVDVSATMDKKLEACRCYQSELHDWPHPRSIEGITLLAKRRGSSVGIPLAEAFMVGRMVE